MRNGVEDKGELNHLVGAEHVQKTRTPPLGVDSVGKDACVCTVRFLGSSANLPIPLGAKIFRWGLRPYVFAVVTLPVLTCLDLLGC